MKTKTIKKDSPRQERRRRSLARLERYAEKGVKLVDENIVPLEPHDINRINKEIGTLKERL
jgi:hypothetical protein